jgi:hypothetical protein
MAKSDNWRVTGEAAGMTLVEAIPPTAIADDTPVLSAAIDLRTYPRSRILVVALNKEAGATTYTITYTVTECATTDGEYTAANVSGTMTAISADGTRWGSVVPNMAKPFLKVTATGSHADVNAICAAALLFY